MRALKNAALFLLSGAALLYIVITFLFSQPNPAQWPEIAQAAYRWALIALTSLGLIEGFLVKKKPKE